MSDEAPKPETEEKVPLVERADKAVPSVAFIERSWRDARAAPGSDASLRDQFAIAAMNGILACDAGTTLAQGPGSLAVTAYAIADAMRIVRLA